MSERTVAAPARWRLRARYLWDNSPSRPIATARALLDTRVLPCIEVVSAADRGGPVLGYAGVPDGTVKILHTLERQRESLGAGAPVRSRGGVRRGQLLTGERPPGAELTAVACSPSQAARLPARAALVLPYRLHSVVDVSAGDWRPRVSKGERKWVASLRAEGRWGLEVARDRGSFDFFYDRMHVPTMRMRHGDRTRSLPKDRAYTCLFRHGLLAFVTVDGARVAGMLCRLERDGATLTSRLVGVVEGDEHWHRQGVLKLGNHLLLEWAEEHGIRRVDFGGLEAWLSKGLFQRKRKLGPRIVPAPGHQGQLRVWWHAGRDTPAVRDFLVANPVLELIGREELRAVYFCDDARPARLDLAHRCANIREFRTVHLDAFLAGLPGGAPHGTRERT
ncbi:GNAT family N-acetyltransferase [Streptomyces sparsogenes]|uniref:GNAT family N-acetyltransferase n=1 Tax=Streptomyces sparsogenes TaxID=67365 RepID=UPI0034031F1F